MPAKLFTTTSDAPFKLSRSKLDLFRECPRCFYLDRRIGIGRPKGPPFTLNSAVDKLLKAEFDIHRAGDTQHPLQATYKINSKPVAHELLHKWRENFHGIQYLHEPTNFLLFGAIDDLWINQNGEHEVVDYKATAKAEPITELGNAPWHDQYRRQMEFYQWLLRQNGLKVSDTGYFVYVTGNPNAPSFDAKLEFTLKLIPYTGSDSWVEGVVTAAHKTLQGELPAPTPTCEYCGYVQARGQAE